MAVLNTLEKWMPTYIQEIERQLNLTLGLFPPPRVYSTTNTWHSLPDERLPMCIALSTGTVTRPRYEGDGTISAWWGIGVGVAASANTEENTNLAAKIYGAAVRAILLQQPTLGGMTAGTEWIDESYTEVPVPEDERRTIRAAQVIFQVLVDDVVTRFSGPTTPIEPTDPLGQPGADWPEAETVEVEVRLLPND